MRIIFMGTPEFALPSLTTLAQSEQELAGVVTQPDRPRGRRLVLTPPPVKVLAGKFGMRVFQPEKVNDPLFLDEIRRVSPDLITVAAYGEYLPRPLLEIPRRGAINLHPSLLPKYRGASPIQHALLNGENETGVTVFYITEKMDAGDIISQERIAIGPEDTYGSLGRKLFEIGAGLLLEAVRDIERGLASRKPQDESSATLAGRIKKSDGLIDWAMPAREIALRVKAFNPWPGAHTRMPYRGSKINLKIIKAGVEAGGRGEAGKILSCDSRGILVATGGGCLILQKLQPEGKRVMAASEFLHGHRGLEGVKLG